MGVKGYTQVGYSTNVGFMQTSEGATPTPPPSLSVCIQGSTSYNLT